MSHYEADPDFVQSDLDMGFEEEDIMYKCNVTDGIEIGMNDTEIGHERASMLIGE